MIRFGVTPEIHALSTILLAVSLALVLLSLKISKVPLTGGSR
jgi:ABC-type spermidine/putrescine transport system permease subunit II